MTRGLVSGEASQTVIAPEEVPVTLPVDELSFIAKHQFVKSVSHALEANEIDLSDGECFVKVLNIPLRTCGLERGDLAKLYGYSPSAMSRWLSGKNLPHPSGRRGHIEKLCEHVRGLRDREFAALQQIRRLKTGDLEYQAT